MTEFVPEAVAAIALLVVGGIGLYRDKRERAD